MLRSRTRSPERNSVVAAIGPESCSGRRVASQRAGFLLVHRGDRPLRPRGLQRLAPARPSPRAVHHRRHHVRPALGALPALPGGRVGDGQPPRPVPLHDALPPPRRERGARVLRLAERLHAEDRFFAARRALLSGPFPVVGRWAAPRVAVSPEAVPFRPAQGVHVVVGPAVDGRGAGGPPRGGRRLAVLRRRARPDHHRRPSSTATCGRPRPPSEPVAARAPNGPGPWSELMPSAGTGSLR